MASSPSSECSNSPTIGIGLARIGHLPAHQHHQDETEQQEQQRGEAVLDADDFVVGGENVFAPETRLVVMGRHAEHACELT